MRGRCRAQGDPEPLPRPQPSFRGGGGSQERTSPRIGDSVHAPGGSGARSGSDSSRDRGSSTRGRWARESRDRRAPLPLGRDGQVSRSTSAREAASAQQSPRRSGRLPAWAHRVTTFPSAPCISVRAVPLGLPPKEGCPPPAENRGCDGLPDLRAPGHRR